MKNMSFMIANYNKIIGWGTGAFYRQYTPLLNVKLDYLIDSNPARWGDRIDGRAVWAPDRLLEENPADTLVVVFSSFLGEIAGTVRHYGPFDLISADQLVHSLRPGQPSLDEGAAGEKIVLTISRANFTQYVGGTGKFILEQMNVIRQSGYVHYHLFWKTCYINRSKNALITVVRNGAEIGVYSIEELVALGNRIAACFIHNLIGMPTDVLDRLLDGLPDHVNVFYYLHDFSCICSNIKMMYNDEIYCRAHELSWRPCLTCSSGKEREAVFRYHQDLFRRRRIRLIAPSENTRLIVGKAFGLESGRILVVPHQRYELLQGERKPIEERLRIAYVGYKSPHKGWEEFREVVNTFQDQYDFYCFGQSDEILPGVRYVDVSYLKDGENAMTGMLRAHGIHIAFLWSVWPETWSYTYFESFAADAFVITCQGSGNIADQVQRYRNGIVLRNKAELFDLLGDRARLHRLVSEPRPYIANLRKNEEDFRRLIGWTGGNGL